MNNDHERLQKLVTDREQQEASKEPQDTPADPSERSDSDQAQDNLERMLETGEENPIS